MLKTTLQEWWDKEVADTTDTTITSAFNSIGGWDVIRNQTPAETMNLMRDFAKKHQVHA